MKNIKITKLSWNIIDNLFTYLEYNELNKLKFYVPEKYTQILNNSLKKSESRLRSFYEKVKENGQKNTSMWKLKLEMNFKIKFLYTFLCVIENYENSYWCSHINENSGIIKYLKNAGRYKFHIKY